MPSLIPDSHEDLLTRPLFAHLATLRAGGPPAAPDRVVLVVEPSDVSFQ